MTSLNIVFAGTPEFALPCLNALHQSQHTLQAVYTQPDRPAGRGRKMLPSAVKTWALAQHLPVCQPLNFRDTLAVEALAALKPDILVVIAYGLILPENVLSIPRLGCVNVHGSLLPRWRGASPVQQAIRHGDRHSGVTIMQMDAGMDTGDIFLEIPCLIEPGETAGSLLEKLAVMAAEPLLSTLDALASGHATAKPQDNSLATYASKINKEDAAINWYQSAEEIDCLIRAFNPWPVAFTHVGEDLLRIHAATVLVDKFDKAPGTILGIDRSGMRIATGRDVLHVERIQFPGGKIITIGDWLNSGRSQLSVDRILQ